MAIESLPQDILSVIFHKLAAQDPLSLLRAAYTCKPIHKATNNNPDVWRKAFFVGSDTRANRHDAVRSEQEYMTLDREQDEMIQELGGYKQLLVARYSKQRSAFQSWFAEQTRNLRRLTSPRDVISVRPHVSKKFQSAMLTSNGPRFLALIRGLGDLLMWCSSQDDGQLTTRKGNGWVIQYERSCRTVQMYNPRLAYLVEHWDKVLLEEQTDQSPPIQSGPVQLDSFVIQCELFEWEEQDCGGDIPSVARRWSGPVELVVKDDDVEGRKDGCFKGRLDLQYQQVLNVLAWISRCT